MVAGDNLLKRDARCHYLTLLLYKRDTALIALKSCEAKKGVTILKGFLSWGKNTAFTTCSISNRSGYHCATVWGHFQYATYCLLP